MGLWNQREAAMRYLDMRVLDHVRLGFRRITTLHEKSIAFSSISDGKQVFPLSKWLVIKEELIACDGHSVQGLVNL